MVWTMATANHSAHIWSAHRKAHTATRPYGKRTKSEMSSGCSLIAAEQESQLTGQVDFGG
jgi:hypothetical protein